MSNEKQHRRVAITGTAQTWGLTPWNDTSVEIWSLNDAYRLPGFQRADRWYDFHPVDKWFTAAAPVYAHQIPPGHYARPAGHQAWITQQQIPVYLHPDYATVWPAGKDLVHLRAFPKAAIEQHFGRYFTSSPAWMMAHAILEGVRDIHVYGIHLATEFEYVKQRPNFEFLMGCLLGSGKRTVTVKDDLRYYESQDGRLVLPEASPVLQESFQYAFDPRPDTHLAPLQWELHKLSVKKQRLAQALMEGWGPIITLKEPDGDTVKTRRARRKTVQHELVVLDALAQDWQDQMSRQSAGV